MKINWTFLIEDDYKTYPKEGCTVLVSDNINYDTAWYLMSGEYKWVKDDVPNDNIIDFKSFVIKKWSYIDSTSRQQVDPNKVISTEPKMITLN